MATSYKNSMNFDPVIPDFKKVKLYTLSFLFFTQIISGSAEPIFTKCSPYGRYFIVDY